MPGSVTLDHDDVAADFTFLGLQAMIDPPRSGARLQAEQIARAPIRKLAYVSCDPASFARDVKVLIEHGFTLTKITPVDQFRWSPHVEVVGAMER